MRIVFCEDFLKDSSVWINNTNPEATNFVSCVNKLTILEGLWADCFVGNLGSLCA